MVTLTISNTDQLMQFYIKKLHKIRCDKALLIKEEKEIEGIICQMIPPKRRRLVKNKYK